MQLSFGTEISGKGRSLALAFVVDPLASRHAYNDPGVALMRAAQSHGHEVFAIEAGTLGWRRPEPGHPGGVFGELIHLHLRPDDHDWYRETGREWRPLKGLDAVIIRLDPPFDREWQLALGLLERAEAEGVRVINRPAALREHPEKLAIAEFPQFAPPSLVARDMIQIQRFIDEHRDVIVKPLLGRHPVQVFRVHRNDPNRNVIVETLSANGQQSIMVQVYLPAIGQGDKRILLIGGKLVPWCLARIPKAGETRGNLAAGGTGVAQELSARDRQIGEALGPLLLKRGLLMVGLDVIGDALTGINVTQPAGMVEIRQQSGFDAAGACITMIEHACGLS